MEAGAPEIMASVVADALEMTARSVAHSEMTEFSCPEASYRPPDGTESEPSGGRSQPLSEGPGSGSDRASIQQPPGVQAAVLELPPPPPPFDLGALQGLSPLKLRELERNLSLDLAVGKTAGSVTTPQFRMQQPHLGSSGSSADTPSSTSSPPLKVDSLRDSWGGSVLGAHDAAIAASLSGEAHLSRFARETYSDTEEARRQSGGDAQSSSAGNNKAGTAAAPGKKADDIQWARAEVEKVKASYAEVKAQREAAAAARAEEHRRQLVEAREARERAKITAHEQARVWVNMLKAQASAARPRVPARGPTVGSNSKDRRDAVEGPASTTQQHLPVPEQRTPDGDRVAMATPPTPSSPTTATANLKEFGEATPASRSDGADLAETDYLYEPDNFITALVSAGKTTAAIERVYGLMDQVYDLLEEPPEYNEKEAGDGSGQGGVQNMGRSLIGRRRSTSTSLEDMEKRIKRLNSEAEQLLGAEALAQMRKYILDRMNEDTDEEDDGKEVITQESLMAVVGEQNMAHLSLVLKTVRQEAAYAEAMAASAQPYSEHGGDSTQPINQHYLYL